MGLEVSVVSVRTEVVHSPGSEGRCYEVGLMSCCCDRRLVSHGEEHADEEATAIVVVVVTMSCQRKTLVHRRTTLPPQWRSDNSQT
jgi:hypothetical protein